jgi:hypothetical protein
METTLRLREGLATLRERGELASLLRPISRRRAPVVWGLAAALAGVAVAGALWIRPAPPSAEILTAAPPSPLGAGHVYTLVTTRGSSDGIAVTNPADGQPVEFRLIPDIKSSDRVYRVTLARPGADGRPVILAAIDRLAARVDGFVSVFAAPAGLAPGHYVLSIAPEAGHAGSPPTEFSIDLVPDRTDRPACVLTRPACSRR